MSIPWYTEAHNDDTLPLYKLLCTTHSLRELESAIAPCLSHLVFYIISQALTGCVCCVWHKYGMLCTVCVLFDGLTTVYMCIAGNIPNKLAHDPVHPLEGEGHRTTRAEERSGVNLKQFQGFLVKALVFPNKLWVRCRSWQGHICRNDLGKFDLWSDNGRLRLDFLTTDVRHHYLSKMCSKCMHLYVLCEPGFVVQHMQCIRVCIYVACMYISQLWPLALTGGSGSM